MEKLKMRIYNLLRWSERYTKTDMTYVASGGFWLTVGQGVGAVSGLLISIAFANLVSPETFGTYRYILSVAGIIGAFSLTGMGTAIAQAVARGFEGALRQGFSTSLKWGLFMTLIAWTGALYYGAQDNFTLAVALFIVGIFQPILNSSNLLGSFLIGKKAFDKSTKYLAIKTLFTTTALIVTIYLTDNPVVIILAYFAFNTVPAVALHFFTLHIYKPNNKTDEKMIGYSKHLSAMNILNTIATHIDKIVVFQFIGAIELAIYSLATALPEQIKLMFRNVGNLALPKFAEKKNLAEVRKTLPHKSMYFATALILVTICYIFLAPYIYQIIFPTYSESVIYSQIFILSLLGTISAIPLSVLQAQQQQTRLYIINVSISIIQISVLIPMAYFYGLWGVVISRIVVRYVGAVITYGALWYGNQKL